MDILNNAMAYIKAHHPDAAVFINENISFVKSVRTGIGEVGYSGVTYTGQYLIG